MDIIELWAQNTGFIWTRTGRLHVTISFEEASGNSVSVNRKEIIGWLKKWWFMRPEVLTFRRLMSTIVDVPHR
jgi:hypothetical protein